MRTLRKALVAALTLFVTTSTTATIASGQTVADAGAWGSAVDISPPRLGWGGVDVVIDGSGTAVAVWSTGLGRRLHIEMATRPLGGSWSRPSAVPRAFRAREPVIGVHGTRAVLAWTSGRKVNAASRSSEGTWTAPVTLHTSPTGRLGTIPMELRLAVNHAGRALLAWQDLDDDRDPAYARTTTWAATRAADGRWGAARRLGGPREDSWLADAVIDGSGQSSVLWTSGRRDVSQLMVSSHAPATGWGSPTALSRRAKAFLGSPMLAGNARGDLAVAWTEHGRTLAALRLVRRSGESAWHRAGRLSVKVAPTWSALGLDADSDVTIAWANARAAVWAVGQRADGSWQRRSQVAGPRSVYYGLDIVVNGRGDALLSWAGGLDGAATPAVVAYRAGSEMWMSPVRVSPARGQSWADTALDEHGNAVAVWHHFPSLRAERSVVQARSFKRSR